MHGYRDHCIRTFYPYATFYCPYSMYQLHCPFYYGYRQKVEEYPIQQQNPPKNPPPNYTPKLTDVAEPNLSAVEFGAISPCIFRMTYLWLKSGVSFWAYLVFINRTITSGWKYQNGQWVYFSVNLKQIKNYLCS